MAYSPVWGLFKIIVKSTTKKATFTFPKVWGHFNWTSIFYYYISILLDVWRSSRNWILTFMWPRIPPRLSPSQHYEGFHSPVNRKTTQTPPKCNRDNLAATYRHTRHPWYPPFCGQLVSKIQKKTAMRESSLMTTIIFRSHYRTLVRHNIPSCPGRNPKTGELPVKISLVGEIVRPATLFTTFKFTSLPFLQLVVFLVIAYSCSRVKWLKVMFEGELPRKRAKFTKKLSVRNN